MTKPRLLIVDDDDDIRTQMKWALASDYEVQMAGSRMEALTAFYGEPSLGDVARSWFAAATKRPRPKVWKRLRRCLKWIQSPR